MPRPSWLLLLVALVTCGLVHQADARGAVLVLNSAEATLSVIDMTSRQEVRRIPVLREPHHWALTPDGRDLLVGDTGGNALFDLDPVTFAVRRRIPVADPYQLGFSPDGRWLTVNGLLRNQVDIYDGATLKLVRRIHVATMPSHLAYSPDSARVFVSLQGTGKLAAIDVHTGQVLWESRVGRAPAGVAWLNGRVLVALMGEADVAVLDPADGRIERRIHTDAGAHQLFLSPDGRILWVNNRVAGSTTALNAATLVPIRTYTVTGGPDDIAFAPDGKLWFTQRFARSVAVLDPASGAVQTIAVGRSPHGIFLSPQAQPSAQASAE
jgi:DNA-binding beta-propeller fold protein YncE